MVPGQIAYDNALTAIEQGNLGLAALHGSAAIAEQILTVLTFGASHAALTSSRGLLGVVSSGSGRFCPVPKSTNPLKDALSKAKPTNRTNQVMHELDDGTRVLFRKDFGNQAHNLGGPFKGKGKIDPYNIQIQNSSGKTLENLHIVPDGKGAFVRFGKDGVIK